MSIDHEKMLKVMSPTLRSAANVIQKLTDGISMRKQINVAKALVESELVMSSIKSLTQELNQALKIKEDVEEVQTTPEEFISKLQFLSYLTALPNIREIGKCRMNTNGQGFELILYHQMDVWQVFSNTVIINADVNYDVPMWLQRTMVDLETECKHSTWSSITVSHFMSYASPYLRGMK